MPKVSVNVVTRNRGTLLREALQSVLDQSYSDYEVVVIDDGSVDNTTEVITEFENKFKKITLVVNETNLGVKNARQQALDASLGQYIAVLDDDDVWISPDKLTLQVNHLDTHPEIGLVGSWAKMLDATNGELSDWRPPLSDSDIRQQMLIRSCFMNPTVMFRKSVVDEVGGYKQSPEYCEDYSLWMRIARVSKCENLQEITTRFRIHNKGLTETKNLKQIQYAILLIIKYRSSFPNFSKSLVKWVLQYVITLVFGVRTWTKFKSKLVSGT